MCCNDDTQTPCPSNLLVSLSHGFTSPSLPWGPIENCLPLDSDRCYLLPLHLIHYNGSTLSAWQTVANFTEEVNLLNATWRLSIYLWCLSAPIGANWAQLVSADTKRYSCTRPGHLPLMGNAHIQRDQDMLVLIVSFIRTSWCQNVKGLLILKYHNVKYAFIENLNFIRCYSLKGYAKAIVITMICFHWSRQNHPKVNIFKDPT